MSTNLLDFTSLWSSTTDAPPHSGFICFISDIPKGFQGEDSSMATLLLKKPCNHYICTKGRALSATAASDSASRLLFSAEEKKINRSWWEKKKHSCLWHFIDAKSAIAISITIASRPRQLRPQVYVGARMLGEFKICRCTLD